MEPKESQFLENAKLSTEARDQLNDSGHIAMRMAFERPGLREGATPNDVSAKWTRYAEENSREMETRANMNVSMADLKKRQERMGWDVEVSGDALARAKRGDAPKLHRSV
jgi:hypothetical protein